VQKLTLRQFSTIITLRIIFNIAIRIITMMSSYYSAQPCDRLFDIAANSAEMLLAEFPACSAFLDGDNTAHAIVNVHFNGTAAQKMAAINLTFGMAGWIALAIHAFGVEVYVRCPPVHTAKLLANNVILASDTRRIETAAAGQLRATAESWTQASGRLGLGISAIPGISKGKELLRRSRRTSELLAGVSPPKVKTPPGMRNCQSKTCREAESNSCSAALLARPCIG
jgi:hypothetical protein